jgi:Concanavalin A-like lectin/glucanases superfamily
MHLRPKLVLKFSAAMLLPLATLDAAVLVNLDATALPAGVLPTWANTGSLAGNFTGTGSPQVTLATPGAGGGNAVNAVRFTGSGTFYTGPVAPNNIGGAGARSIEVWALNPATVDEETLVGWGHRGGPDGTNLSFNWGHHGTWGAVGHWGAPDMPWAPQPVANQWHHLVYTYDGATVRLYLDGQANNARAVALNTYQGFPILIAGQNGNASPFLPAGFNADLSIAKVKVHDAALSLAAVRTSYNSDASLFGKTPVLDLPFVNSFTVTPPFFLPGQPVTLTWNVGTSPAKPLTSVSINNGAPAISGNTGSVQVFPSAQTTYTLTATNADGSTTANVVSLARCQPLVPRHRWSFNEAAGTGTNGLALADSVGGQNAFIRTNGTANATLTGSQVSLPGGASATAPYVDLPNGIVSTRSGDATWEGWVTINGVQNWSRLIDFGSSLANAGNELLAPGGAGNGDEYILVSAMIGTTTTQNRFEFREGGLSTTADPTVPYSAGTQFHIAIVHDMDGSSAGGPQLRYYRNGALVTAIDHGKQLSTVKDNNNWLGRSNWTADTNLQGSYQEFRVFDGAMTVEDVAASFTAGPDAPLPAPLHIDLFAANTNIITEGGSATLYYKSTSPGGAAVASISPSVGTLVDPLTGTVTVSPAVSTTYTYTITQGSQTRNMSRRTPQSPMRSACRCLSIPPRL